MRNILVSTGVAAFAADAVAAGQGSQAANESLWEAARAGDTAQRTWRWQLGVLYGIGQ